MAVDNENVVFAGTKQRAADIFDRNDNPGNTIYPAISLVHHSVQLSSNERHIVDHCHDARAPDCIHDASSGGHSVLHLLPFDQPSVCQAPVD